MVFTTDAKAPLVAVVGATGNQGGSVIDALKASDKQYRVRGLTRDTSKPAAKELQAKGVEVVAANVAEGGEASVAKAFEGADFVFGVTNFWETLSRDTEVKQGKIIVEAVKAAHAKTFIWSGLPSHSEVSGGKYTKVDHFDGKDEVTKYAHAHGVPTVQVQAGFYASNFGTLMPYKTAPDGTVHIIAPAPNIIVPVADIPRDYGYFVRQVIEHPDAFPPGSVVRAASEYVSFEDIAQHLTNGTQHKVKVEVVTPEEYKNFLPFPELTKEEFVQMLLVFAEFGYYGKLPLDDQKHIAQKTLTFAEYVKANDFSKSFKPTTS